MTKETIGDNGAPKDLKTWFTFLDRLVQNKKMSMTYARNDSGIECDFSARWSAARAFPPARLLNSIFGSQRRG